MGVRIWPVQAT